MPKTPSRTDRRSPYWGNNPLSTYIRLTFVLVLALAVDVRPTDVLTMHPSAPPKYGPVLRGTLLGRFQNGWMLRRPDSRIVLVPPQLIASHQVEPGIPTPVTLEQMKAALAQEFPGFKLFSTRHYLLCFNTDLDYARRRGSLFEKLYLTLRNYFTQRGFKLATPQQPLVSIVFASHRQFLSYAKDDVNLLADNVQGYYSPWSNRTAFYNPRSERYLALKQQIAQLKQRRSLSPVDRRRLAQLEHEVEEYFDRENVTVTVHEATHQVAFNSGLHARLSKAPRWAVEGLAMYFEVPHLSSRGGWHGFGRLNPERLQAYRRYERQGALLPLTTLLASDEPFMQAQTVRQAYCQAWALTYFLFKRKTAPYRDYMKHIASLTITDQPSANDRIQAVEQSLKTSVEKIATEWRAYMKTVR